jgi:hypothetical protein
MDFREPVAQVRVLPGRHVCLGAARFHWERGVDSTGLRNELGELL